MGLDSTITKTNGKDPVIHHVLVVQAQQRPGLTTKATHVTTRNAENAVTK